MLSRVQQDALDQQLQCWSIAAGKLQDYCLNDCEASVHVRDYARLGAAYEHLLSWLDLCLLAPVCLMSQDTEL